MSAALTAPAILLPEETDSLSQANCIESVGSHAVGAVETSLGWMAVAASQGAVTHLTIGHADADSAIAALSFDRGNNDGRHAQYEDTTLVESLLPRLVDYADGVPDDFRDVPIHRPDLTDFGHRVIVQLRQVKYGETVSYAELAERVGSPKAARAVGRVMATNLIPLILPCHRVVGSAGRLGGFSAPQGIDLKRRMLELEGRGGTIDFGNQ